MNNAIAELGGPHNRKAGHAKDWRQIGHRRARRTVRAAVLRAVVPEPRPNKPRWAES